jgi:hypothetical protein
MDRFSRQCGILDISQSYTPPWPATWIALLAFICLSWVQIHEVRVDGQQPKDFLEAPSCPSSQSYLICYILFCFLCTCIVIYFTRLSVMLQLLPSTLLEFAIQCVHKVHSGFWEILARKQVELATCSLRQITAQLWKFFTDFSRPRYGLPW